MVVYRQKNEHAAIAGLWPNTPFLIEIRGVAFNIRAIKLMYGYDGDLCMGFLVNLLADLANGLRGRGINDAGKVIHVPSGLELLDRLGAQRDAQAG
jgi:hypothetical protein